jgi:4-hydroxy-2-oxoglutarate aldolase
LTNPDHNSSTAAAQLSKDDLRGVLLPITTPFHSDGALDLDALRSNIRKWNETGIIGYVLLGSTGERVHLDEREYLEIVAAARDEVPAGMGFIVGAGQQSTRGTINEIQRVTEFGHIDAVLVITPGFYRASITQAALLDHYREVADASPVPVMLYSMPALTGIRIEPETAAQLSEHRNIIGLKDSSPDTELLRTTIGMVADDFAVLTGNGTVLESALSAGACGGVLAVGCVATSLCLAVFRTVNDGNSDLAATLQAKLTPLAQAVTTRFGIGGLKAALDMKGWQGGSVRAPLRMPDEATRDEIRQCLEEAEKAMENHAAKAPAALPHSVR